MGGVDALAVLCAAASAAAVFGRGPGPTRVRNLPVAVSRPRDGAALQAVPGAASGRPEGGLASGRVRGAAAVLAGLAGAAFVGGAAGWVAGAVIGAGAWFWLARLEPGSVVRAREQAVAALPLAAELLAAALAAGSPPERAAEAVGRAVGPPLGTALMSASASLRLGAEPAAAWEPLRRDPQLQALGRALAGAGDRGTSPVPALERVAHDARDSLRWTAEARARSLGARAAAPLGLCFLPAFVLVGVVPLIVTAGLPLLP